MQVYLPIAEMAVNPWLMLGVGSIVGIVSGTFGIGGGFLLTPLLILTGIPAPIAVASGSSVTAAAAMSSLIPHVERKSLDLRIALFMTISGVIGVSLGAYIFKILQTLGFVEIAVRVSYVILLSFIGTSLLYESIKALRQRNKDSDKKSPSNRRRSNIGYKLPFKIKFPRSKLYISIIPPIVLGFIIGVLSAIMGIGGGFLLVPALVYVLNMPASLVVGTSVFQVLVLSSTTSFLQSTANGGLDIVLSSILMIGAVVGAQIGGKFGNKLKGEELRVLLGSIIIILALVISADLILTPDSLYVTSSAGGGL